MKLQKQPSNWTCLPTSFAMVLKIPVEDIFRLIGHDGSHIQWPDLPEPQRRRSFHIQEMILVAYRLHWSVTPFEPLPQLVPMLEKVEPLTLQTDKFEEILRSSQGVLTGLSKNGQPHAVAWDGHLVHDPNGRRYGIDDFNIQTFWRVVEM